MCMSGEWSATQGAIFKSLPIPSLRRLWTARKCTNVCTRFRMFFVSVKFVPRSNFSHGASPEGWRFPSKRLLHLAELIQTSEELHECLKILFFWIAQLKSCPSQTFMFFFLQVSMVLSELCWRMIIHIFHASNNVALKHFLEFIYWVRRLICHT